MSDRRGAARLAVAVAALLALLAAVALASRAGVPWSGTTAGAESRSLALVFRLVVDALVLALAVGLFAVFIWHMRRPKPRRRKADDEEEDEEQARSPVARFVLKIAPYVLLVLIVAGTLVFAREVDRRLPRDDGPDLSRQDDPTAARGPSFNAPPQEARWLLATAGGLAFLLFLVATGAPVVRRRYAARVDDDGVETVVVSRLLAASLDDLRAEPDPRRAVVAAYARMEGGLEAAGHGRRAFEAPLEYLGRVLESARADPVQVGRLTHLFERAKFSRHPVGPEDKADAIDCLVEIRDELRNEAQ
jgi:hypothetical protein